MLASELIERLQQTMATYGNHEVCILAPAGGIMLEIQPVEKIKCITQDNPRLIVLEE